MKIVRVIYDWPPPWYGLSPHPYELTLAQVKAGHEVEVFCGRWPKAGPVETFDGVNVHAYMREPFKGLIFFTTALLAFFGFRKWKKRNTYDILHVHGHMGIWFFLHRHLLKKYKKNSPQLKIPLVAHFHNTIEGRKHALLEKGETPSFISSKLEWPLARYSDMLAVKNADALIFAGEEIKDEAIKYYGADANKCYVVESGVNTDEFHSVGAEEKGKTRSELGFDHTDIVVLNHGYMVERKNIHSLVEAFKYLPEQYRLFLVGPFDSDDYRFKINTLIEENKLQEKVTMTGYVPYPETPIAFQASDLFVLPSSFEGVPKVVMQSLSCGVPALVSGFRLNEEIQGLKYLDTQDPKEIADQIVNTFTNYPAVDVAKVQSLYSWKTRARLIDEIYASLKQNIS